MLKKELAKLLGVSASMVSRHAKMGMPIDSLERALRWRKRHLEPGRVKGSRYDPTAAAVVQAGAAAVPGDSLAGLIVALNKALMAGQVLPHCSALMSLRMALRLVPVTGNGQRTVAMPVRVWVALIRCVFADNAMVGLHAAEQGETVTAEWVSRSLRLTQHQAPEKFVIEAACDFYGLDGAAVEEDQND